MVDIVYFNKEDSNKWKGVIIEESLNNPSLLNNINIVNTEKTKLENDIQSKVYNLHKVEVDNDNLPTTLESISSNINNPFYAHLVNGDTIHVAFPNKIFTAKRNNRKSFNTIKNYGKSLGIPKEQLNIEKLIDNPFDE